jgi:hypothetical protein
VENKITSLERQFRQATDWAENTGQGVSDPGDFEAAILKRCPLYKELEPIMGERPNARPLSTNEDNEEEEEDESPKPSKNLLFTPGYHSNLAVDDSLSTEIPARAIPDVNAATGTSSISADSSNKRLSTSSLNAKGKNPKKKADDIISSYFGEEDDFQSLRSREVSAREREADARMLEAEATSAKTRKEIQLLAIEERVRIVRERKKLLDDGICTRDELDDILPLPK